MPKAIRLAFTDWPQLDHEAWNRSTTAIGYFDDLAPAAAWSTATKRQAQSAWGRLLAFLRDRYPDTLTLPPAKRLDRDHGRVYVEMLADRIAPMSVAAELGHLLLMLRVLAPAADWSWLRQWQRRYQRQAVSRDIRHKMVHPGRLVELAKHLMDTAQSAKQSGEAARQYRDGCLLGLVTTRPLRRRSLQELTCDHLRRVGDRYALVLHEANTKSRVAVEMPLPAWLAPYLCKYLEEVRPQFPRADSGNALWLSAKGGPLGADAIYRLVCRRTKAAFGEAIFPHLMRHIAATEIARERPAAVHLARDLLTQRKLETTTHYYIQSSTLDAAEKYQTALDDLCARGAPKGQ